MLQIHKLMRLSVDIVSLANSKITVTWIEEWI